MRNIFMITAIVAVILLVIGYYWFLRWRFIYRAEGIIKRNPELRNLSTLVHDVINDCEEVYKLKDWLKLYREYTRTEEKGRRALLRAKLGIPD